MMRTTSDTVPPNAVAFQLLPTPAESSFRSILTLHRVVKVYLHVEFLVFNARMIHCVLRKFALDSARRE
jgi:hypothetical protein